MENERMQSFALEVLRYLILEEGGIAVTRLGVELKDPSFDNACEALNIDLRERQDFLRSLVLDHLDDLDAQAEEDLLQDDEEDDTGDPPPDDEDEDFDDPGDEEDDEASERAASDGEGGQEELPSVLRVDEGSAGEGGALPEEPTAVAELGLPESRDGTPESPPPAEVEGSVETVSEGVAGGSAAEEATIQVPEVEGGEAGSEAAVEVGSAEVAEPPAAESPPEALSPPKEVAEPVQAPESVQDEVSSGEPSGAVAEVDPSAPPAEEGKPAENPA